MTGRKCRLIGLTLWVSLFAFENSFGGSAYMAPEDTVFGTNAWSENRLGEPGENEKVYVVTDFNDIEYIYSSTGASQLFTFTNPSSAIPDGATIDSFVIYTTAQVDNDAGTDRIRHRVRMDGNSNYCDGVNIDLSNTWTVYSEKFTATPTSGGVCDGALTEARMDSLNIQYLDVTGDENRVTQCSVLVWYTEAGGQIKKRRRKVVLSDNFPGVNGYELFGHAGFSCHDAVIINSSLPGWLWKEEETPR
ncbi:MAG TPA: hypothetical protein VHP63_07150 [candidate division Zixibacteria bacterium]|nr:hypothetical protein [candidate division Zixibacteria bacterium]